jgi:hypothetical protein
MAAGQSAAVPVLKGNGIFKLKEDVWKRKNKQEKIDFREYQQDIFRFDDFEMPVNTDTAFHVYPSAIMRV